MQRTNEQLLLAEDLLTQSSAPEQLRQQASVLGTIADELGRQSEDTGLVGQVMQKIEDLMLRAVNLEAQSQSQSQQNQFVENNLFESYDTTMFNSHGK
jgi:hypothetical protein